VRIHRSGSISVDKPFVLLLGKLSCQEIRKIKFACNKEEIPDSGVSVAVAKDIT
jgi:hypothetical protein